MAQSLSKILLHAVFSTKRRARLILSECEKELHGYIASIGRAYKSNVYKVGGTETHIHIACILPRTITVAKLMEEMKKSSSKWIKEKNPRCSQFSWQSGYSVFSLGHSQLNTLISYIENQKKHHALKTFKEELIELLKKYDIDYDENYLWD